MSAGRQITAGETGHDAPDPPERQVENTSQGQLNAATYEPRLTQPGHAAGELRAGTAGAIGREYLKAVIARLDIPLPQRTAESAEWGPAEWEPEAGG